jgi:hypothetical protein
MVVGRMASASGSVLHIWREPHEEDRAWVVVLPLQLQDQSRTPKATFSSLQKLCVPGIGGSQKRIVISEQFPRCGGLQMGRIDQGFLCLAQLDYMYSNITAATTKGPHASEVKSTAVSDASFPLPQIWYCMPKPIAGLKLYTTTPCSVDPRLNMTSLCASGAEKHGCSQGALIERAD